MSHSRHNNEEIIAAYRDTGSVWKAGRRLGISGQTVHARLRAIGHKTGSAWTPEEKDRLTELVGQATIGQIADELGRSYAAIACQINEMGIGSRFGNSRKKKVPRGAGLDKASISKYIKEIEKSKVPITKWAKQRGMIVDTLVSAIEKYHHDWWISYRKRISYLPESTCPNCGTVFYPSNSKQVYCRRACASQYKTNQTYFGGKRNQTIGLAEGICQCCGRKPKSGLSSHHVIGKENDADNDFLVALCRGCHKIISMLGGRNFEPEHWEALISFAIMRRDGDKPIKKGIISTIHVCVDIDSYDLTEEEFEEMHGEAA